MMKRQGAVDFDGIILIVKYKIINILRRIQSKLWVMPLHRNIGGMALSLIKFVV